MNRWKMVPPLMVHQGELVLERLALQGFEAYFVGGCVRDELMGRPVHDMDIATSATPEQVVALFDRTVPTGIQHGTVTVLMEDHAFEVTTFRKEAEYEGHRRPSEVQYVRDLEQDLQRRDFTMNAIAMDRHGQISDPYHGLQDIEAGVIRAVGSAAERFDEDALRMVRAVRFASVFGFRLTKSTWSGLRICRDKIAYIATERIRTELEKMIAGPRPLRGLELLRRSGLLEYINAPVPISALRWPAKEGPNAWLAAIEHDEGAELPELRWSLLLQGLSVRGEEAVPMLKRWTFSRKLSQAVSNIIIFDEVMNTLNEDRSISLEARRTRFIETTLRLGKETAEGWLLRRKALIKNHHPEDEENDPGKANLLTENFPEAEWYRAITVFALSDLKLSGGEIIAATGRKGGPWLTELLNGLLLAVAAGELTNEKNVLLEHAKAVVNTYGHI